LALERARVEWKARTWTSKEAREELGLSLALCRQCCTIADMQSTRCTHCGSSTIVFHDELESLTIAHVDCDAFYASVEKRDNPDLRDKPLLVGHPGGRGVVTTACYIARKFGPRSAMPMFKAIRLCPEAVIIPPDMAKYKAVSREIRAVFTSISDCIEPVSLDEAYIDLTPDYATGPGAPAIALAKAARRIKTEIGITVSVGLSYNKFLAKLASDLMKPDGYSVIGRAEARDFVAGLPVGKIHGVGRATAERMQADGFELVSDLQMLSERELVARFGKFGRRLALFVNGEDDRAVEPERETKSISAENTFDTDTGRYQDLMAEVGPMCERVAERLRRAGLAGSCVVLKLKTSDFKILSRSRRLGRPTQRADVLLEHTRLMVDREADGRTFRLIGVGVADLAPASEADPPDLFSAPARPLDG
jgi:DNA polymerase-4